MKSKKLYLFILILSFISGSCSSFEKDSKQLAEANILANKVAECVYSNPPQEREKCRNSLTQAKSDTYWIPNKYKKTKQKLNLALDTMEIRLDVKIPESLIKGEESIVKELLTDATFTYMDELDENYPRKKGQN